MGTTRRTMLALAALTLLSLAGPRPALAISPAHHIAVELRNVNSSKCVHHTGFARGSNVVQNSCNGNELAQRWFLEQSSATNEYIIKTNTLRCLDVSGSGTRDGTNIQIWDCNSTSAQRFEIRSNGSVYTLRSSLDKSKCLDVQTSSTSDGANVQLWTCNNSNAQNFQLNARAFNKTPNDKSVRFFAIADTQMGYGDDVQATWEYARDTMAAVGRLIKACTNCVQVLPIAGDLTNDDGKNDGTSTGYRTYEEYNVKSGLLDAWGIKVLDAVGNHDLPNDSSIAGSHSELTDTSFSGKYEKYEDLYFKGHQNAFGLYQPADGGACKYFNTDMGIAGFCTSTNTNMPGKLQYYATRLGTPGSDQVGAVLLNLHNNMCSGSAYTFLQTYDTQTAGTWSSLKNTPLVLMAHQTQADKGDGADCGRLDTWIRSHNVAAIIVGHYHCNHPGNSKPGHCDKDATDFKRGTKTNKSRNAIPVVNVNAALHNIFWGVTVNPATGKAALRRFDRKLNDLSYSDRSYESLLSALQAEGHGLSSSDSSLDYTFAPASP